MEEPVGADLVITDGPMLGAVRIPDVAPDDIHALAYMVNEGELVFRSAECIEVTVDGASHRFVRAIFEVP